MVLFKYMPKEKRNDGQKALTPVRKIVNSLITSYTFSLGRIDQSVPTENLVIRTSLSNKRVVLRGNSSNSPIKASSLDGPPLRESSQSQKRSKKNNTRGLAKTNKQINISHEGGVLKASFQSDLSETL